MCGEWVYFPNKYKHVIDVNIIRILTLGSDFTVSLSLKQSYQLWLIKLGKSS